MIATDGRRGYCISTRRPSSRRRSCWRPARAASSISPASSATVSGAAPCAGVHDARMVSRRRGLRAADARLRRHPAHRGRGGGPRSLDLRAGASTPGSSRSGSRWPRPSTASPVSICWRPSPTTAGPIVRAGARRREGGRIRIAPDDTWSDVFTRILVEKVEPAIGNGRACILCDYPVPEAALARPKPGAARRRALRALCLRRRAGERLRRTHRPGGAAPPLRGRHGAEAEHLRRALSDRRGFLAALAVMPEASGAALGFDRLVMLATGRRRSTRCSGHRSSIRSGTDDGDDPHHRRPRRGWPGRARAAAALRPVAERYAVALTPRRGAADRSGG